MSEGFRSEETHTPGRKSELGGRRERLQAKIEVASQFLQCLYSLDTASPGFLRHLYCLIHHDEEEQYLSGLQGSEITQLVDFLDVVRALPPAFRPFTERILQTLSAIPTADDVFRQCLHKLQTICGHHITLPSSHNMFGDLARVGDYPISVNGGSADVWEGTHNGRKVCIKCPRVSEEDLEAVTRVRVGILMHCSCLLKSTRGLRSHSSKRPLYGKG